MMENGLVFVDSKLPWLSEHLQTLESVFSSKQLVVVDTSDDPVVRHALTTAEIALLAGDLDDRYVEAPNIRWIHCDHAGLTKSAKAALFEKGIIVTGSAGRSGPALAEHVMMFALMLCSRYPEFYEAQKRGQWLRASWMWDLRALQGRTLGIIGMGHTGVALAQRAKAFNMNVLGFRRRVTENPAGVDHLYCSDRGDTLDEILAQSDVLALVINLSDATYHMIGRDQFRQMKKGSILINLARGDVVDQEALIDALVGGHLLGAGLDVTSPEPLASDHPLWRMQNVIITPHFTPSLPDKGQRSVDVILDNFKRYLVGQPMLNELKAEDVWTRV